VCVCVCVCACVCVCMLVYVSVCMRVYMCMYVCVHARVCVYVLRVYADECTCVIVAALVLQRQALLGFWPALLISNANTRHLYTHTHRNHSRTREFQGATPHIPSQYVRVRKGKFLSGLQAQPRLLGI